MTWTTPKDLKAQLARLWDRGELLRDAVNDSARFPLRLSITCPGSADISDRFEAVRAWTKELTDSALIRVEWQQVRHRVQGLQRLPSSVWIDSMADALAWLGRRREWDRFVALIAMTRQDHPHLLPWLAKRPLQALQLADDWQRLLAVVSWLRANPRPGIYLRQVDLPGVHSKFIEAHRGVLAEWLDLALPPGAVDTMKAGITQFAARYGFLDKPTRIRFRVLDPDIQLVPGASCPDVTLDADSFSQLACGVRRVLITENETNFLALPHAPATIAVFGSGYGWDALTKARWLEQCEMRYWGDIDTHGFAILDQLRGHFAHVASVLMDRATLDAHAAFWGFESKPQRADLHRLTPDERDLYDTLRDNRIREGLRLEQEHLRFGWVRDALDRCLV